MVTLRIVRENGQAKLEMDPPEPAPPAPAVAPRRTPRACQVEAAAAFTASNLQRVVVSMPTGTGKSFLALMLAGRMKQRTLFIAHRHELIMQPAALAKQDFPELDVGIVKAGTDEYASRVVLASIQTLSQEKRLERVLSADPFDLVVVDEAHHAIAKTYVDVLRRAGCWADGGPRLLGLSATAERTSKKETLGDVFQGFAYYLSIKEAVAEGYLCTARSVKVKLPFDLSKLRTRKGDFVGADLEMEMDRVKATHAVAVAVDAHARGRKTAVFALSVRHAHEIAVELKALGLRAEAVDGTQKASLRRYLVERFRAREIDVLVNCQLLTEGWDDPEVSCVVVARPTKSRLVWIQMGGRGLRLYPGKSDCLIIDTVGASDMGLVTADAIAVPEEKLAGAGGGGGGGADEAARVRSFLEKATSSEVKVLSDVSFYDLGDDAWATVTTSGTHLVVRKDADGWNVVHRNHVLCEPFESLEAAAPVVRRLAAAEFGGF